MDRILYVIIHGIFGSDRYDNIVKTWGNGVDYLFYGDYESAGNNIIKVSNRTDYSSGEEKHVNIFPVVREKINYYDWFFFCDDDTFVNTKNLSEYVKTADKNLVHGEVLRQTWPGDLTLTYCSGGAGYLIHSSLIPLICDSISIRNTGYGDVSLGICLRDLGIKSFDYWGFKSQPPPFFNIDMNETNKYISFHYIKTLKNMEELYSLIN